MRCLWLSPGDAQQQDRALQVDYCGCWWWHDTIAPPVTFSGRQGTKRLWKPCDKCLNGFDFTYTDNATPETLQHLRGCLCHTGLADIITTSKSIIQFWGENRLLGVWQHLQIWPLPSTASLNLKLPTQRQFLIEKWGFHWAGRGSLFLLIEKSMGAT